MKTKEKIKKKPRAKSTKIKNIQREKKCWQKVCHNQDGYLAYKLVGAAHRCPKVFCGHCGIDMRKDKFKAHANEKHLDAIQSKVEFGILKVGEKPIDPQILNWAEFAEHYEEVEPILKFAGKREPLWLRKC